MNWLRDVVRPKLNALVGGQKDIPDNLWHKCPSCGEMIFHRDLEKNLHVCQHCGHHMRISAQKRLELLFDEAAWTALDEPKTPQDPLKFKDRDRYTDRLKKARAKTGREDAVVAATGTIGGHPCVVALLDFDFMGGSMGIAVGEAILNAAKKAVEMNAPLIAITGSGGARMQEGILSLMQLPRTTVAVEMVKDAGLPYIVLLTDPTTGGVSASFAMLGDIQIAEPGAVIGFAGRRVIEQTIRETLPGDFQTAEYLLDHGMIDMVVRRKDLPETIGRIIGLLTEPTPDRDLLPAPDAADPDAPDAKDGAGSEAEPDAEAEAKAKDAAKAPAKPKTKAVGAAVVGESDSADAHSAADPAAAPETGEPETSAGPQ
jgi:acetyl-CoA carboxylase carboxyl transferase subunit beta